MSSPELLTIPVREIYQAKALVAGEGKPVVFLHGTNGLKWNPYLEELSKEYKVIAPYFPGAGGSTRAHELDLRNLWDVVLYYLELFDTLGLERIDLIGHSFGGMLAAEIASTDPKRIDRLMLVSASGLWNEAYPITDLSTLTRTPDFMYSSMFYDPGSAVAERLRKIPEDAQERMRILIDQSLVLAETSKYMWPIPDKGLSRRIHRIRAQTCIVWGEKDGLVPVEYAYEFQEKIPGSQVFVVPEAAHFPHLEQLSQVVGITVSFLSPERAVKVTG